MLCFIHIQKGLAQKPQHINLREFCRVGDMESSGQQNGNKPYSEMLQAFLVEFVTIPTSFTVLTLGLVPVRSPHWFWILLKLEDCGK